ncbi:MAG TPA: RagB/SusD family nutrient uptake outer membrane protein [Bacteroidales bacterium]|nr:RagB/SusD family nutrient uptake outer membrane protein [Bacteroidales bacterium]HRC88508.1 RagB/SusD family nutrient uptake outer membrane protein [Bacteroidales bacterium]
MKKIAIIMASLVVVAIINSCSDTFLERPPLGATFENVFYNEKGVDALLTGTYAMVKGSALWTVSWGASIQNWTYGSVASDDAYKGSEVTDQVPVNEIERWEVTTTNNYPAEKWRLNIGMGVDRANKTLRILKVCEEKGTVSPEKATQFRAELRFLRGLFYFESWLVFGDYIPLIDENVPDPALVSNDNQKGAVLNFIISDLQYAWENLPASQALIGRPTKYAAMALAARAYLQELKYDQAKPLLDNIINSKKYELMPKFIDNFNIETENNKESIFEIQACVNDINESLNAEMGIGLNFPHGGDIGMCCGFHQPSQNLVNAFKVDDNGLPLFDTFNDEDLKNDQGLESSQYFVQDTVTPVDPRLDFTVGRRGIPYKDWGIMRGSNWIRKQSEGGPYLPASKPFFKKSQRYKLSTTTGWQTGVNANNYRYLRYSHVLLWRAEIAAYEGDLATALDCINQVRERAGKDVVMGRVRIFELPVAVYPWGPETTDADYQHGGKVAWDVPAANYKVSPYTAFANKEEAMRAAQWEQRLEFATEGRRFFDLRRWDNLPESMKVNMVKTLNDFAAADLRIRDFMKGANFSNKDKFMPVPQTQLDLQPGVLVQNPDYR